MGHARSRIAWSVALLGFIWGASDSCAAPHTEAPPAYYTLSAIVEIDGQAHTVGFTWRNYDKRRTDAYASGLKWRRVSSFHSVLRILSDRTAIVLPLPFPEAAFEPSLFLIDPQDLTLIHEYRDLVTEAPARGRVRLQRWLVTLTETEPPQRPMSKAELALREKIEGGGYGTIQGLVQAAGTWRKSPLLVEKLTLVREVASYGRRSETIEGSVARAMIPGFGFAMTTKPPPKIGFEPGSAGWVNAPRPSEFVYQSGFARVITNNTEARYGSKKQRTQPNIPIPGIFRGKPGDFSRDELWFDPARQEVIDIQPVQLVSLKSAAIYHWENGGNR
jgi:hypothetical protein